MRRVCRCLTGLLVLSLVGCPELADRGINTVSIKYGVTRTSSLFGGRRISHVNIQNPEDKAHTNARVELQILQENGDVLKKVFHIGTVEPGATWEKELDPPLKKVASIDFRYTCDQGAGKGTLDIEHADWESEENDSK